MGSKDSYSKKFLQNNEVFADAFNMLIYNGRQIIKPDELTPLDTSALTIPYRNEKAKDIQRYRDILKLLTAKRTDKIIYLILGIESQTDIHYAMPVRNMLYDAIQYSMQIDELSQKNHKSGVLDSNTFLSGIQKEDKITPIITLTVYLGTEQWDGPTSLREMFSDIDQECLRFIQDYQIFLLAPQLPKNDLLKLQSELREVMMFINCSQDKEKLQELLHADERFAKLSISASFLLNSVTGKDLNINQQKENFNMCKAIDDMIADAKQEGRNEMCKAIDDMIADAKQEGRNEMCKAIDDMIADAKQEGRNEANQKIAVLSTQNTALSSENSVLKTENASLLSQVEMLQMELKRVKAQMTN